MRTAADPVMDNWESGILGGSSDTEAPVLTGSITIGTKTTSSIAMSWPAGSDNVAVTSYEVSSSGGSSWTDVGNVLTHTFTGLSAGTSYDLRVRAKDAASNVSTPALAATESTLASDSTPPTMNGSITVGTKTSGSISISYPAASDNVAVTGYEVRVNGGTWLDNGTSLSYTALGLTALTSCTIDVRAYDGAGNRAVTPLSATTSTYRAGDTAANIIANTGPVGGNPAGFLYAFASTVTSTDWLSYTIVSGPAPSGGTLDAQPDGRFTYTGPAPATMVIQPEVNGVNAAETITVTLYDAAPDGENPELTGDITITSLTSTGYDMECPAGTDNVGVTGYEYSLNGGTSWTDNGNDRTASASGRTPESTDAVRWRCYDAAGNKSNVLSASVTLLAAPDVNGPLLTLPTAYASGPTTASGTVTTNEATGTLYYLCNNSATATDVAVKAGLSQAVTASGIQTVNVTGLTASTPGNYIHYLHQDGSGNDSLVSSSAAFTTPAEPAPGVVSDEVGFRSCMRYPMESAIKGALA